MTSRLDRLNKLVRPDLQTLLDRPPSPEFIDEDTNGGVSLENLTIETTEPTPEINSTPVENKQPVKIESKDPTASSAPNEDNSERRFVWVQGAVSSYNLGSALKLSTLPTVKLSPSNPRKGQPALASQCFTPIIALSKFPYKFCNPNNSQEIATAFFDAGKFWVREWDLYYIWDIGGAATKPLILVLEHQVDQLLKEINIALKLQLKITDQQREDGLVGHFPDHPGCLPRYLGRSCTREEFDDMAANAPMDFFRPSGESSVPPPSGRTLEDFKKLMEDMWSIQKNKNNANKEKKRKERLVKQQSMNEQFKRAQRYLGLRSSVPGAPPPIDPSVAVPFSFDQSVVFVCVDVESYEKAHNKITEVGVATLDTRHLIGIAPGPDGEHWRSKIHARHFRIREHRHLINQEFIQGCPDRFEFGESEFIHLRDAAMAVGTCFKPPFCATMPNDDLGTLSIVVESFDVREQRNLIFLGHDTLTDVKYLQQLGFDPLILPNVLEAQDSATLYRVWRREPQITNLGKILYDFNIAGWNLHNAGNDAVYTIQAMLATCVRESILRSTVQLKSSRQGERDTKVITAVREARRRAKEEAEGWSDAEL